MSILKNLGITLGVLAIVGGGSLAVISASAQGRAFDSNAVQYITNGDLAGYKNYLIGQATTRINAIDQTQFDKIKTNYTNQKPLLDLVTKYEPQLTTLATNKDQAGFESLFKQFQAEAKPIMEAQMATRQAQRANQNTTSSTDNNGQRRRGHMNQNMPKTPLTDSQLTEMANREYNKAVADIASGKAFRLGFGGQSFGKPRGMMGMKGGMHDNFDDSISTDSTDS